MFHRNAIDGKIETSKTILMGPWLECGKGICFASRQIEGSTPFGSTKWWFYC